MPQKLTVTRRIELDGGGDVTFWVNPPSGFVRRLQRATAKLNLREAGKLRDRPPQTTEEMQDALAFAERAFEADDEVWACVLPFVEVWTLTGWNEADKGALPVSMDGLDMLPGEVRTGVLTELSKALDEAARLDPQSGRPSSSTSPAGNDTSAVPANISALPVAGSDEGHLPYLPSSAASS